MHKQWQDLLPYYVAGTLPRTSAAELERHLAGCESCRRALNEWRMVAGSVQAQAEAWAIQAPPLAPELRVQNVRPSSNGFGGTKALAEMQEKTIRVMPSPRPAIRTQRIPLPMTMAAAVLAVVLTGVVLLFLSRQEDETASLAARPTHLVPLTLGAHSATPTVTRTVTRTPLGTPPPMTGIQGILITPSLDPSAQVLSATPAALYSTEIGMGSYRMITLTEVGAIPAGTRIRIGHAWYTGVEWMYGIYSDTAYAEAHEWQIAYGPDYGPGPTPTAKYGNNIGASGYPLFTTATVGIIPPNTRVRISYAYYGENGWLYGIVAQDEITMAEAYDWQLAYAPEQGGPTPYPLFEHGLGVSGYPMRTVFDVGAIPADSRVRISSAWYTADGWVYEIVAEDEQTTAQARENELTYAPDYWPGATPTAQYNGGIGTSYDYVTFEQVKLIPANTRVRIVYAYLSPKGWIYGVIAQDGLSGGEVYEWQLVYSPQMGTPTWTPTAQRPPIQILSFTASPNPVERGGSVVIRWNVNDSSYISLMRLSAAGDVVEMIGEDLTPQGEISYTLPGDWTESVTFELRAWDWYSNEIRQTVVVEIACPVTPLLDDCPSTQESVEAAYQPFERGFMVWWKDRDTINVHYDDGTFETLPLSEFATIEEPTDTPPDGLYTPPGYFGRIWSAQSGVRDRLGWGTGPKEDYVSQTEQHSARDEQPGYVLFTLPDGRIVQLDEGATTTWQYRN